MAEGEDKKPLKLRLRKAAEGEVSPGDTEAAPPAPEGMTMGSVEPPPSASWDQAEAKSDAEVAPAESNESDGEKKPIRLSLRRSTDSSPADASPPPVEDDAPSAAPESEPPADSAPVSRFKLKRTSAPVMKNPDTPEPVMETPAPPPPPPPPPPVDIPEDDDWISEDLPGDGDDELIDYISEDIPEAEETIDPVVSTPPEDEPAPAPPRMQLRRREPEPEEPAAESPPPELEPEPKPLRMRMSLSRSTPAEEPENDAETQPAKRDESDAEEMGWEGSPEAQLPEPKAKSEPDPTTSSGLKLKTKDSRGSEAPMAPEGMSHGTLTPFERDKAVSESKKDPSGVPASAKPPVKGRGARVKGKPPKGGMPKQGKEKGKGKGKVPAKKAKAVKSGDGGSPAVKVLLGSFILLLLVGGGAAVMMIMGVGPFASNTDPASDPTRNGPIVNRDPAPDSSEPATGPLAATRDVLGAAAENAGLVDEITGASTPDPVESEPEPIEINEDGKVVVKVGDDSPGPAVNTEDPQAMEGGAQDVVSEAPKPIEEAQPKAPDPDPEIQRFVDGLVIQGMIGGDNPKIIVNNTPFERGTFVSFQLGLQFMGIRGRTVYFRDRRGAIYSLQQ